MLNRIVGSAPFQNDLNRGKQDLETEFERLRPDGAKSRITGYFACAKLEFCCVDFGVKDVRTATERKYYEVEMPSPTAHPMVLMYIAGLVKDSDKLLKAVIDEYWLPKHRWYFLEYIDTDMTIEREVESASPELIAGAKFLYGEDLKQAKRLFVPSQNTK